MGKGYRVDLPDKEMIHVPGRTEWDGIKFHHATQNGTQLNL